MILLFKIYAKTLFYFIAAIIFLLMYICVAVPHTILGLVRKILDSLIIKVIEAVDHHA